MFEAFVLICATSAGEVCREALLPGYEAETRSACAEALSARPPEARPGPVVAAAPACRPVGETLPFEEVAPGLFVHEGAVELWSEDNRGDIANIVFVVGGASVAVIDPGSARWMGEAVWRSVRAVTDRPVSHVIVTHMHPDHVLGTGPLAEAGAQVVGHADLPRALADRAASYLSRLAQEVGEVAALGSAIPQVDVTVAEAHEIDLGGRVLELRAWPTGHSPTDLTALDRTTGILIAGDLVFDAHTPALDGSLRGWQRAGTDLAEMDLAGAVPGHGAALLAWPGGIAPQTEYLDALARDTRAALDRGLRLGDAVGRLATSQADLWHLFSVFNPRNATVAYTELEWE